MPAFGWSVGDLVSAMSVVAKVSKALKDVDGAVDYYRETISFLESPNITLNILHGLYEANVEPNVLLAVQSQLELIQKPIDTYIHREGKTQAWIRSWWHAESQRTFHETKENF
ncbi:hypothetical protein DSL72_009050 [Monilinia vaccinii-corymbosi]|uniref:Uncharacterized protein n=1 Tax=Monilinia vaccinii-corymbosi TaxID=61207 RepID=A0A8A3PPX5_9HELO|nr:hypothetical protein DSL72_009050 [Monilinia vaccinii-corymbosi]